MLMGNTALAVRRFDRIPGGGRIHMEDFAQALEIFPEGKYKNAGMAELASIIATVIGPEAAQDFVARITFVIMTGNGDMHLKNWSLLYPDTKTPVLSPAYDLVSTVPYISNDQLALNLAEVKDFWEVDRKLIIKFVKLAALPLNLTLHTVERIVRGIQQSWPELKERSQMPPEMVRLIENHMNSLPLVRDFGS
jgi:serine/threonine-protein kinase HipA